MGGKYRLFSLLGPEVWGTWQKGGAPPGPPHHPHSRPQSRCLVAPPTPEALLFRPCLSQLSSQPRKGPPGKAAALRSTSPSNAIIRLASPREFTNSTAAAVKFRPPPPPPPPVHRLAVSKSVGLALAWPARAPLLCLGPSPFVVLSAAASKSFPCRVGDGVCPLQFKKKPPPRSFLLPPFLLSVPTPGASPSCRPGQSQTLCRASQRHLLFFLTKLKQLKFYFY